MHAVDWALSAEGSYCGPAGQGLIHGDVSLSFHTTDVQRRLGSSSKFSVAIWTLIESARSNAGVRSSAPSSPSHSLAPRFHPTRQHSITLHFRLTFSVAEVWERSDLLRLTLLARYIVVRSYGYILFTGLAHAPYLRLSNGHPALPANISPGRRIRLPSNGFRQPDRRHTQQQDAHEFFAVLYEIFKSELREIRREATKDDTYLALHALVA
ncbi:unnamed protein product [Tilletia laevis]|uniref:Uncharacterized protein n=2 Tax=Tilletia TaxID=13289 RepID=A0A9N8M0L8_9BASI|nr:hypothetical protein A4X03_0g9087 [Tilletia caries]CAD6888461.1 unnamed protein product [Tilletia caries]CAD6944875.1 unnamed protein product [Tilletia caries]CAD6945005.1 unnamed protein product [Tilletia laevis]CAD7062662.1 unnamed protein product [Tilletia caries]